MPRSDIALKLVSVSLDLLAKTVEVEGDDAVRDKVRLGAGDGVGPSQRQGAGAFGLVHGDKVGKALPGGKRELNYCGLKAFYPKPWLPDIDKWRSESHNLAMSTHSVADARNHLSELIDRALEGEGVVITRHGQPVVELRPLQRKLKTPSPESWEWLAAHRASLGKMLAGPDAGQFVSDMRDEGEH